MKTLGFIGSDKNAGKTTAFNFVYETLRKQDRDLLICLASTGINGESVDNFDGRKKPEIDIQKGTLFVTRDDLAGRRGTSYEIVEYFDSPEFARPYMLASSLLDARLVLEGPNSRNEIFMMKETISRLYPDVLILLDGSVDRQFMAHPLLCDGFYFSILISDNPGQLRKAEDFLMPIFFGSCNEKIKTMITRYKETSLKSIVLDKKLNLVYKGEKIPFMDQELKKACRKKGGFLYLNGALTRSMWNFIYPLKDLAVVLDHFTLFQNISTDITAKRNFQQRVFLLNRANLLGIFKNVQLDRDPAEKAIKLPEGIPVYDLSGSREKMEKSFYGDFLF